MNFSQLRTSQEWCFFVLLCEFFRSLRRVGVGFEPPAKVHVLAGHAVTPRKCTRACKSGKKGSSSPGPLVGFPKRGDEPHHGEVDHLVLGSCSDLLEARRPWLQVSGDPIARSLTEQRGVAFLGQEVDCGFRPLRHGSSPVCLCGLVVFTDLKSRKTIHFSRKSNFCQGMARKSKFLFLLKSVIISSLC